MILDKKNIPLNELIKQALKWNIVDLKSYMYSTILWLIILQ